MEEFPKTLAELDQQFATEKACIQYLYRLRWPDGLFARVAEARKDGLLAVVCVSARDAGIKPR